jgi:glycosyltransferase involved in cell wall biosynthesis
MNSKPLVSAIIIFLNEEEFIREAIESVFAQTYGRWELILVDDGSTDGSTAIAQQYMKKHPGRVCYLEHEGHQNRGMSASRNLGIRQAKGQFIAFLDADDVWLPHKLEQQVAILESQPEAAMVYGPTQWWYSWTEKPEDIQRDFVHELGVPPNTLIKPPMLLARFLEDEGISPCTCSVLVRREVVERTGGFEEIFRGMYEDQAFCAKVCLKAPVYVSGECGYRYRQHPNSCVSVAQETGSISSARLVFVTWLEKYLSEQGIKNTRVWHTLRRKLWPYRHANVYLALRNAKQLFAGMRERAVSTVRIFYGLAHHLDARLPGLPIIRRLRCLQLRRLQPLGNGRQRGTAIVRYYWAHFLQKHQRDIQGHALEIGSIDTLRHYGDQAVTQADAMDLAAYSPDIRVVADLSRADDVPADTYDCFVNQFTMHLIYDVEAALYHSIRILKSGGVLLINFPCVDYYFPNGLDMRTGAPLFLHWWFTPIQVENLLRRVGLSEKDFKLDIYGNLFARVAYQMNMPAEELSRQELEYVDPGHPLLICVRAVKPLNWQATKPAYRDPWLPKTTPARWNPSTGHYAA